MPPSLPPPPDAIFAESVAAAADVEKQDVEVQRAHGEEAAHEPIVSIEAAEPAKTCRPADTAAAAMDADTHAASAGAGAGGCAAAAAAPAPAPAAPAAPAAFATLDANLVTDGAADGARSGAVDGRAGTRAATDHHLEPTADAANDGASGGQRDGATAERDGSTAECDVSDAVVDDFDAASASAHSDELQTEASAGASNSSPVGGLAGYWAAVLDAEPEEGVPPVGSLVSALLHERPWWQVWDPSVDVDDLDPASLRLVWKTCGCSSEAAAFLAECVPWHWNAARLYWRPFTSVSLQVGVLAVPSPASGHSCVQLHRGGRPLE